MTPERILEIEKDTDWELTGLSLEQVAVLLRRRENIAEEEQIRLRGTRRVLEERRATASREERERVRQADLAYVAPPAKVIKVVKEKRATEDAFDLSSLPEA